MKKLKTLTTSALTWLKASRRHQIIVAAIIVVLLAVSASAIVLLSNNNKSEGSTPTFDNPGQTEQKRVLHVTSNIPGITMSATPRCDDDTTEFKTPKDCTLASNQSEVIVTAPSHAVIEGKTYIFKSWDGCSASNEDWKICKFIPGTAPQAQLTAHYLPLSEFTSKAPGNTAPQPNQPAETPKPKNLREQCESSKVSSTESNSVRCTVVSDGLFLGFDWNNKPEPSPQPPITVKCLEINTMDCKVRFTYAPAGTEPAVIKRGASLVVNSTYKIGRQNPGPAYPSHVIGGTAASTGETQNNEVSVTLSAPLSFATGEHTYQFTNYSIYVPSYQRAGTSSDYFNWMYDTSN